jgi:hypothetical protein
MSNVFANRVLVSTATTGTGTVTLGPALAGYRTFASAGIANAALVRYLILDGNAWEIGTGTYTASGTTLSRTVQESSAGGTTALNLTGGARVAIIAAAQDYSAFVKGPASATNDHLALFDGTTGKLVKGGGIRGTAANAAVVTSDTDVTAGRLLTTVAGPAQAFRRGNILGTVSQSGGVPTGAAIERGSNANGEFVRLADGTQICWSPVLYDTGVSGNVAKDAVIQITWTFPATFAASSCIVLPSIVGAAGTTTTQVDAAASFVVAAQQYPSTSALISARNVNQVSVDRPMRLFAVASGRWF